MGTASSSSHRRMNSNSSRQSSSGSAVSSLNQSAPQATQTRNVGGKTIYIKSSCSKKLNDNLLLLKSAGEPGIDGIEIGKTVVPGLKDNHVPVSLEFVHEEELQNTIKWIQGLIGSDNVTCERLPTHPQSQIEREEYSEQNTDKEKTIYVKRPHSIWKKTTLIRESGLKDIKTANQVLDEIGIDMTDIELLNDYSIYRLIGSEEAIQNAMKMIQDTIGKANISCEKPTTNIQWNEETLLYNKLAMLMGVPNVDYKTIEYYLHPFILHKYPRYARKVTDILLEMERSKLYHLIRDPKALDDMVKDVELMSNHLHTLGTLGSDQNGNWYPDKLIKKHTQSQRKHSATEHASLTFEQTADASSPLEKKTVYVKASVTKKLNGNQGRKIKGLINRSGVQDMQIERKTDQPTVMYKIKASNGETYVPVHIKGSEEAVQKAFVLIQGAVGKENVEEEVELLHSKSSDLPPTNPDLPSSSKAKNSDQPQSKYENVEILKGVVAFKEVLTSANTTDARNKIVEEHFYALINKTQPELLARKITDMLYDEDNSDLLQIYEQYCNGNLSALEDKIQSSIKKIEDDKRADRNRKKNAKKRQRKKEEAAARAKIKQAEEETRLKEEVEARVAAEQAKYDDQQEKAKAGQFELVKAVSSKDASVCSKVLEEDEDPPSDMNAASQEDDISMTNEAIAGESAVLEEEEAPPSVIQPLKETNHLPNQYEDVPGVTECISSTTQDYNKSIQEEEDSVFSKIGNSSNEGMTTRETITESSVSSKYDESKAPKALSTVDKNENGPLLIFLRSQHACIKGSVDEFYTWLVKSEDIDSMLALKEAVSEEEYLNNNMKKGSGSSGVKGFKLKPFQRAVREYFYDKSDTKSSSHLSLPQCQSKTQEPPDELVCPISLVLMTNDPVLAADGITYERVSIEDWFKKSKAKGSSIYSPVHGTEMDSLTLMPNIGIRNMARAFKDGK